MVLYLQNEGFKELIIKLGVNPEDREEIKALIQGTKVEVQSLK